MFGIASLSLLLVFAAAGSPIPLYNAYRVSDGLDYAAFAIASVGYFIAAALALLVLGRISNHLGRKPVSLAALATAGAGTLLPRKCMASVRCWAAAFFKDWPAASRRVASGPMLSTRLPPVHGGWLDGKGEMTNTRCREPLRAVLLATGVSILSAVLSAFAAAADLPTHERMPMNVKQVLPKKQLAIAPIAAATAVGDMPRLNAALNDGLDAGLTVSDTKEILVQLYAYAGFPRSLNALGELMKVLESRRQRGIQDVAGRTPGPVPTGKELLAVGTANQTKLSGAPVKGPLFEFAPAIDEFLKTHLFGDIFARDNLDWASREIATVAALAAMPGVESQLQSHLRISMNVGLSASQLRTVADELAVRGHHEAARRVRAALNNQAVGEAKR